MALAVPAGSRIGQFFDHSYWAARLKDGSWLSEIDGHDWRRDVLARPGVRYFLAELWLFGPKMEDADPQGQAACLDLFSAVPDSVVQTRTKDGQQWIMRAVGNETNYFVWSGKAFYHGEWTIRYVQ